MNAFPLKGEDGNLLGVLLIAHSRRDLVQFLYDIRAVAFTVGGAGILVAILAVHLDGRSFHPSSGTTC